MPVEPARTVEIVEVGPRDGLQNESRIVPTAAKIAFIDALTHAGLRSIEATSFVNPKAVPQLADAVDVMRGIERRPGVRYSALVPNERGLDRALEAGVDAIAVFTAATDAFCQANIRCTIDESFDRFEPVVHRAKAAGVWIRGYVSVAFDCPYSGRVRPEAALAVADRLFHLGCDEVSIADTIGTATPDDVTALLTKARATLPFARTALHFHDTTGQAIDNVSLALDHGVTIFDSSAGGLGGCPFAPGAPGNLSTERLLAFLEDRGIETGIDRAAVDRAATAVQAAMQEPHGRASA
ncbi:MAG TPA: hydroxymethylglutaryl-CoA lyase [Thermomicrobiales bacterium]|nr:hydroxymethylglutaryl-CoA lyase [Thermomicrobiales bacterium]